MAGMIIAGVWFWHTWFWRDWMFWQRGSVALGMLVSAALLGKAAGLLLARRRLLRTIAELASILS